MGRWHASTFDPGASRDRSLHAANTAPTRPRRSSSLSERQTYEIRSSRSTGRRRKRRLPSHRRVFTRRDAHCRTEAVRRPIFQRGYRPPFDIGEPSCCCYQERTSLSRSCARKRVRRQHSFNYGQRRDRRRRFWSYFAVQSRCRTPHWHEPEAA